MPHTIQHYRQDDDPARDHELDVACQSELGASVSDDGHDQRADDAAEYGSLPAGEACPADHARGDDIKFHADRGGRIPHGQVRELEDPGDCRQRSAEHIDEELGSLDAHAAQARGLFV